MKELFRWRVNVKRNKVTGTRCSEKEAAFRAKYVKRFWGGEKSFTSSKDKGNKEIFEKSKINGDVYFIFFYGFHLVFFLDGFLAQS